MRRSPLTLVALTVLSAGGCHILIGLDEGKPGGGGSGGSSSSSSSCASSSSSTSSSSGSTSSSSSSGGGSGGSGGTTSTSGTGGSTGGGGGSTSSSSSSSSGAACDGGTTCGAPEECTATGNECVLRTCDAGCCGTKNADLGTPTIAGQVAADCKRVVCDGAGGTTIDDDELDPPAGDDACHVGVCTAGVPGQAPSPMGTGCAFDGGKVCGDPAGATAGECVECNTAADCTQGRGCAANKCAPTVLILAGSSGAILGGEYHPGGSWTATTLGGMSTDELTLAFTPSGQAFGAFRIPNGAPASDQVWFTRWPAPATFAAPSAIDATSIFARAAPSITATSVGPLLVFHGTTFLHYTVSYASAWSTAQGVGPATFGPTAASIAAIGDDATITYYDGDSTPVNKLTAQTRVSGVWQAKVVLDANTSFQSEPMIIALTGGAELMVVYARADGTLRSVTRTSGVWSAPVAVPGALMSATVRPAVAPLPGGEAVLAFRGNDGFLYWSRYSGGAWVGATSFATPNLAVAATPSLARGVGGAEAEIAFIQSDKKAYHARLVANAWSTPALIGGSNLSHLVIASAP